MSIRPERSARKENLEYNLRIERANQLNFPTVYSHVVEVSFISLKLVVTHDLSALSTLLFPYLFEYLHNFSNNVPEKLYVRDKP